MPTPIASNRFLKDSKLARRRGLDTRKLEAVIELLASGSCLPASVRDHALVGQWKDYRDCHIEPD